MAVADDASDAFVDTALAVMDALKKSDPDGLKDLKTVTTDAMDETTKMLPPGSWSQSRRGTRRTERGSRTQLIG